MIKENSIALSGFSDEICPDFLRQLSEVRAMGLKYIELRGVDEKNISELTAAELDYVKKSLEDHGIKVSSLGSPVGKMDINEDFEPHFEMFKKMVDFAAMLETPYIRIFSFYTPKNEDPELYYGKVREYLERFISYAREKGIVLLHENEKGIYGDIAPRCEQLMKELYSPNFKAVFDFANFVECGQNTPEAYTMLKPYIAYVHIKDALMAEKTVVPPGDGDGHLAEILKSLKDSGYRGFLSLEPHLSNFSGLKMLEKDGADRDGDIDGLAAWSLALKSLKSILWDIDWR